MVKHLLCVSLLLVPFVGSMAQSIKKADDVMMFSISQNGKYACSSSEGVAVLWNTEKDNAVTTFDDGYYYCDGISDDGVMAGSIGEVGVEKPILFSADKTTYLPMPEDRSWNYGSARGISPDGSMVCGYLARADVNVMDNTTSTLPFVWEINGDNITCTALPYPEKDFTGRCPQGYHPIFVSTDKNRILGRQIDYSGFGGAIAVWQRTAPGEEWTCTLLGEDVQYKDGPDFPEFPEKPERVDYADYMTEDELAAYNAAYQEYVNGGYAGTAPKPEDYIGDATKKAEYIAAMEAYNLAMDEYSRKFAEFNDVYMQRLTDYSLSLYSLSGSFNGRYVGCTLNKMDFSTGFTTTLTYPCYYDLDNGNKFVSLEEAQYENTGIAGRITDNGDVVISNPAMAGMYDARNSYIIPAGENKPLMVYEFMERKTDGKVNRQTFVDAGMEYSWTDNTTGMPVEVADSVLVGSTVISADGMSLVGFCADPSTFVLKSWALNNFGSAGIGSAVVNKAGRVLRTNVVENGLIEYVADVKNAVLSDMGGSVLFNGEPQNGCVTAPAKGGIYLLQSKLEDGTVRTDKIIVK